MTYGVSRRGQTQLANQALVRAVEQTGLPAVYVETEPGNYRPKRLAAMSSDEVQAEVYKIEAYGLTEQFDAYGAIADAFDDVAIVVIDSFTGQFRLSDRFDGRQDLSERSAVMGAHLNATSKLARELSCPVLMTAQVYASPEAYGKSDNIYGGMLMQHTVGYFVRMSSGQGSLVKVTVENHPGQPDDSILVNITENGVEYVTKG